MNQATARLRALAGRARRAVLGSEARLLRLVAPALAPVVKRMAETGAGTDACLRRGALPLPVHFYSPVPDVPDLDRRAVWGRHSELPGLDFAPAEQLRRLAELGKQFGDECSWPAQNTGDPTRFFSENGGFSFGCAAAVHCLIRAHRPKRVIEVGSGNSSLVIAGALERNGQKCEYTVVDPYPGPIVRNRLPRVSHLREERVELVELDLFETLEEDDVLFVDSGHTVRVGGDVNYLILDVLPRLRPGVVVHFHDIPMPAEYPRVYASAEAFRVLWTESYLLQAFLAFNASFDILLAMSWLMQEHLEEFQAAFPHYDPKQHAAMSGSFWIRRR